MCIRDRPNAAEQTTTQSSGGLLSGLLSSSSAAPTGVKKNDDGTETVSYKLPYARMFVEMCIRDRISTRASPPVSACWTPCLPALAAAIWSFWQPVPVWAKPALRLSLIHI